MNHYPSPPPLGSPAQVVAPHWQQQLLKYDAVRQARSPHHRAKKSAMAARNVSKSAIPITNPNKPPEDSMLENHPSSTVAPIAQVSRPTAESNWSSLDMGGVNIKTLPATSGLFSFTFLVNLFLNHNALEVIPPQIAQLRHLELLDISGNHLTHLPPELGMVTSLKELYLFDNNISTIPAQWGTLHQLQTLGIEGNPLDTNIKTMIQREGTPYAIAYLRDTCETPAIPRQRQWQVLETGSPAGETFNVLCYNVLCERAGTPRMYGYTPQWALLWDYRKQLILAEIQANPADFICLQEVDLGQYEEFFTKHLGEHGYKSVHYQKARAKNMSEEDRKLVDGCATFYNANRYKLVEDRLLDFAAVAMRRSDFKKTDDMFNRVLGKDYLAVVCLFEDIHTGTRIIVSNAHLLWPASFSDVKLVQTALLVDEIQSYAKEWSRYPPPPDQPARYADWTKIPVVVCGDFNSVPDSGVYEFLSNGHLDAGHPEFMGRLYGRYTDEGLDHRLHLKSAYAPTNAGELLPFTNFTSSFQGVLDYLWYSTPTLGVTAVLGEIDKEYLSKVVGFPNAHYPSDHVCISAKFRVKPPASKLATSP
ncbi:hypothetical protein CYLTODRAFT_384144 [Cylindrobasidium torrendii FP15055 ss-10]|uniref:CCR4-Not complex 3'-5'-exoribonuclease subunit Ccr4 n=1 Tax=Cylindrobasidium torrendii FP15055 ss-10 TaxID=1314674 RepID=A0A0D7AUG2_9AGAR|nr:hypothetical protein CYLTODRAFT_384144 [Cylindrobasidium torrendii FP15055 ss-10]